MAEPNSDPLFFKGTSPEECEVFVATIRRRAFDQGKQRDNEWVADLASTYFIGDAFYWYEKLDEDVQNDWRRLRPALVARFGRRDTTSTMTPSSSMMEAPTSSITTPTPAAAPPTTSPRHSVRKGHLKVLDSNGSFQGYIAIASDRAGVYDHLCASSNDALKILFTVSSVGDGPFEIEIIVSKAKVPLFCSPYISRSLRGYFLKQDAPRLPQGGDKLVIAWPSLENIKWMDDVDYYAAFCSFSTMSSNNHWAMERRVWKISEDGVLGVEYPKPDGSFATLRSSIYRSRNYMWWKKSSMPDDSNYFPVRIVIEDAV